MTKYRLAAREKGILAVLSFLLIVLGYYLYILQPILARQATLTASIVALELEELRLEPLEQQEPALRQEVARLQAKIDLLTTQAIPMHLPQLLVFLERAAQTRQVSLQTIGLQNVDPLEGGLVNLTLDGNYLSLHSFLRDLEGQSATITLEQVRLSADGERVSADLTFRLASAAIPERPGIVVSPRQSPFTLRR